MNADTLETSGTALCNTEAWSLPSDSALMVNRVVGSGIFDLAPILLDLVGSKGAALCSWLLGCLVTLAG